MTVALHCVAKCCDGRDDVCVVAHDVCLQPITCVGGRLERAQHAQRMSGRKLGHVAGMERIQSTHREWLYTGGEEQTQCYSPFITDSAPEHLSCMECSSRSDSTQSSPLKYSFVAQNALFVHYETQVVSGRLQIKQVIFNVI